MKPIAMIAAVALALGLAASGAVAEGYGKQKVVYHINYTGGEDQRSYLGAMRNIQNHINAVGAENLDVRIVLHGDGLNLLMAANDDIDIASRVDALKAQSVGFTVCNNTVQGRGIDLVNDLHDVWDEDIVASGVAELSHLQQQGYTYIKP